jgi:hypothetical protein
MSTEQKDTDQNALAARLGRTWSSFKDGKLLSYRTMAILLLLCAGLGLWWYIASERRKTNSQRWMDFDDANTVSKLEDLKKNYPNTSLPKIADLLVARTQLGPDGIDLLTSPRAELRQKGIENIEKARTSFGTLLEQFKDDPVAKAECLYGLAMAEMALVGVPVKSEQPTGTGQIAPAQDFRGNVDKVIEYLDQLSAAAAPDTPWATESKKRADEIRKDPLKFKAASIALGTFVPPSFTKEGESPFGPLPPNHPPIIGGLPGGK